MNGYNKVNLSVNKSVDISVFPGFGYLGDECFSTSFSVDICFHFSKLKVVIGLLVSKKLPNFSKMAIPFCIPIRSI